MAYNILVVDDSRTIRTVLKRIFSMIDIDCGEVLEAKNGLEALEIVEREWIDIIFADINMPVMNGLEMVEELQRRQVLDKVPVVIVSTEGSQTRIESLINKGIRAFIRKPVTPEIIKKTIDEILEDR